LKIDEGERGREREIEREGGYGMKKRE